MAAGRGRQDGAAAGADSADGRLSGKRVFIRADLNDSTTWYHNAPENDGIVPMHHAQSLWDIRQTKNLYREPDVTAFLDREVEELRAELGLGVAKVPVRVRDVAAMIGFLLGAPFIILGSFVVSA